jgi:PAS domain S-box-containing protein
MGDRPDVVWAYVTLALSAAVVLGYAAIAVNWYFQVKVRSPAARAALVRLAGITLACAACGGAVYGTDAAWEALRASDVATAGLAAYTWTVALRMRGIGLVDERLSQVEALERRAEGYREIAELLPHLVWTATADGRVDYSNRRWIEYAGGAHPWTQAVHDDDHPRVAAWWARAVAERRGGTTEARLRGACGGFRTFLVSATPIEHGGAVRWLGACADVEDQKQLAAERERQARQRSFFLSALSHDLRSPLNVVQLHAELLRGTAEDAKDAETAESARAIMENAAAASGLIDRLLDFAKVGSLERNASERVSLADVLAQVRRRLGPVAERKGLYLREADGHADVDLWTDRHKLERIVGNLVENAIKYTQQGGVTIAAEAAGDDVVIEVRDTGIGVPPDKADSLFDEFVQVGNDERDRRKGFGLGLTICRSLARQLGGDVRLAGTGPGGSRFEVRVRGAGVETHPVDLKTGRVDTGVDPAKVDAEKCRVEQKRREVAVAPLP